MRLPAPPALGNFPQIRQPNSVQLDSVFDIGRRDRISGTTGEQLGIR
jgi:hypothetical protein